MTDKFLPSSSTSLDTYVQPVAVGPAGAGGFAPPSGPPPLGDQGVPWARYFAAIKRYKWLAAAIGIGGTAAAFGVSRLVPPAYDVRATVWVSTSNTEGQQRGPIRAGALLQSTAWTELFRSLVITDAVVNMLHLYVRPVNAADSSLFADFGHNGHPVPGAYILQIDAAGREYSITDPKGVTRDRGAVTDSLGRNLGFRWAPKSAELRAGRKVEFTVVSPRQAAMRLSDDVVTILPEDGNFLRLGLSGTDPVITARTLNTWGEQFVATAASLKRRNLVEYKHILETQLVIAENELRNAEIALESFRVKTIVLPTETGAPISAGVEQTRNEVMGSFFRQKSDYDEIRHDREALEKLLRNTPSEQLTSEAMLAVPGVLTSSPGLQAAFAELSTKQAALRAARQTLTDEHPTVKALVQAIRVLQTETVPQLSRDLLQQLRQRESDLGARIAGASTELQRIPTRTIEELRLRRQVSVSENLYNMLKTRYEEAKLSEAGATPDVTLLDTAIAPLYPSSNSGPRIILLGFVASFGIALVLVILLDRLDRRFRYPEQATHELGLAITGAVPRLKQRRSGVDIESLSQTVEAFRTLRLSVRYAFPGGAPVTLTVTSPSAGDGKSLVSSNLALSFANAGYRTLLIDGDIRRGRLHATFGAKRTPGLIDILTGRINDVSVALHRSPATSNLWLLPSGTRSEGAPELLGSDSLNHMIASLRREFDVIIVDSPPLSAGIDAFALGVATGSMMLVLRTGYTDRKLAEAKLKVLDRLPVRLIGAALN
ncbi:MAG TPA: polysaccharide biosynthesis tyrosine autokinase, partial [Gemmatimonadaceae bacterium]|nr:polysaccharide biosynthesis tyrosine autokinase [Gemmatimonadaceae bacterium]